MIDWSAKMSDLDTQKAKKIGSRDWHEIRSHWIEFVPTFSEPGSPPEASLFDLPSLDEKLAIPKSQTVVIEDRMPGVRQGVLHDGVYLFHKAVHIFGATLVHSEQGMCTWSLSSAYHSAYFAAKSILCLLGISTIETPSKGHFLLDVWHTAEKQKRKPKDPSIFIYNSGKIEHWLLWACFQRAVAQSINLESVFDKRFVGGLMAVEPNQFAQQRNFLHYRTSAWNFDDLHACATQNGFGIISESVLDSEQDDFLLILAFGLVHAGRRMIGELANSSKPLSDEVHLIDAWLAQPFNRSYHENSRILLAMSPV